MKDSRGECKNGSRYRTPYPLKERARKKKTILEEHDVQGLN